MTDDSAKPNRHELKKYQRVRNEETEKVSAPVNDLMVSASKPPGPYIRRALLLFNGPEKDEKTETEEKPELFKSITLMGRGKAVNKVVQIAEIVKRRVKGLHQITKIENTKVTDHYKPKEKESGLEDIHIDRTVGGLHITLSLDQLDANDLGYQQPIPEDQVVEGERPRRRTRKQSSKPSGGRGRAAGRGGARRGGRGGTARGGARGAARGNSRPQSAGRGGSSKGSQRGRRGN